MNNKKRKIPTTNDRKSPIITCHMATINRVFLQIKITDGPVHIFIKYSSKRSNPAFSFEMRPLTTASLI